MKKQDTSLEVLKKEFNLNFSIIYCILAFSINPIGYLGKAHKVYDTTRATAEELKKIYEERLSQ